MAILPQFITPGGNVALDMTILGAVSVLLELPILVAYGAAASLSVQVMGERPIAWIEGIGGGVLIALGGGLVFLRG